MVMTGLRTPIVTVITGEGGSGGALALAVGDVVLALENSIYSVISPEGAASILWRSAEFSQQAAMAMRLTAAEQHALGVIDEVVPEPANGAHADPDETAKRLRTRIAAHLDSLAGRDRKALLDARYARYRNMGEFAVAAETARRSRSDRASWRASGACLTAAARPWSAVRAPPRRSRTRRQKRRIAPGRTRSP